MIPAAQRKMRLLDRNHVTSSLELAFRVTAYCNDKTSVRPEDLMDRFGVSRTTAYRYWNAWRDSKGVHDGR